MLKKTKKLFQSSLLLLIFSLGFFSAQPDCYDLSSNLCFRANSQNSTCEASISASIDNFSYSAPLSFPVTEGDFCCKENTCDYEGDVVYGNQGSKIQKHSTDFVINDPIPFSKNKKINLIFDQYRTSQTTPVYILTQSFLC